MSLLAGTMVNVSAQKSVDYDKGWIGSVELDPAVISVEKGATSRVSFTPRLTATHKVMPYLALGGGISLTEGWNFKGAPSMEIFARAHAENFTNEFTPFFDLDLGYFQSFENTKSRGFAFNPTIGIRYGRLGFGIGYKGAVYTGYGSNLYNSINIRLAYYFGYHKNEHFCESIKNFFRRTDFGIALGAIFPTGKGFRYGHEMNLKTGATMELSWLYRFSNNFSGGLMIGLNYVPFSEDIVGNAGTSAEFTETLSNIRSAITIGLRGRYDLKQLSMPLGIHPYAKLDLGVAANLDTEEGSSSFYYSPGVGLSLPIKDNSHSLDLGVSYAPMSIEKENGVGDVGSVRLTLGYTF